MNYITQRARLFNEAKGLLKVVDFIFEISINADVYIQFQQSTTHYTVQSK